ncbi:pirin family protein [Caulobacter endophyticus]|uniref:Pirin n=1 Tax=Caulobacter endophyticus TaxID=2172652 RepID=A0A2T9K9R9_9CAUL|nr:pirin family protein [Caulobacter endophyticus]PVM92714.1 pirin [Caulobacter endophyticus]
MEDIRHSADSAGPTVLNLQRARHGPTFQAFGLRGSKIQALCDPYLNIDHAWMSAPTFPPHPHAGFSAISYVFADSETGLANRDSLGTQNLIAPGGLHWTAAGQGIVHEERPAEPGKTVHALQIFVDLPPRLRTASPFVLGLGPEEIPIARTSGAAVRVALGDFAGQRSPLQPPNDVGLLDITLNAAGSLGVAIPAGHVAILMPIAGATRVEGRRYALEDARLPVFPAAASQRQITLTADEGPAQVVVFTGRPLAERLV